MRRARGQALTEYALLLGLVSGINFVRGIVTNLGEQPPHVLVGAGAVVLIGGWLLLRR
jgi:Flp pilus assembly pilin Flp